jgi:M6 family metalloprotease-like protein
MVFGDTLAQETQFNNITIFIRFNDETDYEAPYDYTYYDDMFNAIDQPSLKNYYLEVSYGALTIDSFIPTNNGNIIFYTDTYDREYFEPYSELNPDGVPENGQAEREHNLIKRALDYVDESNLIPDEMDLDVNNDGEIDSVTFMISGEDNGWNSLLWPHKWELYSFTNYNGDFDADAPVINGVNAYRYTWELLGNSQSYENQVDVGVLAHETFHLLGAPDLYHYYEYLDVTPVGYWGLMEYAGEIPSHMLGYMKEHYAGWIGDVTEITESGSYTLYPMQDNTENMYKIYTGIANQWIYLEYRDDEGYYESQLPYSGLLVYRVNTGIEGNESGSYDEFGNPTDEVFIFRPGMDDIIEPIILEDIEGIDGSVYYAALSDKGTHNTEIGLGTTIPIFSSEGAILNIRIYNVVEENGYITFDVYMDPQIELISEDYSLVGEDVLLYDSNLMDYEVRIRNIASNFTAYYTLDGTTPTSSSDEYIPGDVIDIDARNNIVTVALYDGTELVTIISEEYDFTTVIESDHNPYQDNVNRFYYFDFGSDIRYTLRFSDLSETEADYDYLYVEVNDTIEEFTGNEMQGYNQEFVSDELLIRFYTDEYVNQYFGFLAEIEAEEVGLSLLGDNEMLVTVYEPFVDPGAEITGTDSTEYTLSVVGDVDVDTLGEYTLTYQILDSTDTVILEQERTVLVVDDVAPVMELIGEDEINTEVLFDYIDQFVTVSDNYDSELIVVTSGEVDTTILGTTVITYTVVDSSGNETVVVRTVHVVDTTAPTGIINDGVDTIQKGEEWVDGNVLVTDNFSDDLEITIEGTVDTSKRGEYTITYIVKDDSLNELILTRIVTITDPKTPIPEVVCNEMITTLSTDDTLIILPCYISGKRMETDQSDVSMTVGIHEILHYIELNGIRYEHRIFYYVYETGTTIDPVAYIERRREY